MCFVFVESCQPGIDNSHSEEALHISLTYPTKPNKYKNSYS